MRKITRPITNVATPVACKKIKGKWDRKNGVCIQFTDNKTFGVTAPIRGTVFGYWAVDLRNTLEMAGEELFDKRNYAREVIACPVDDFEVFPDLDWYCCQNSIFHNYEFFEDPDDRYKTERDAYESAKVLAMEVANDVKQGRARDWSMEYYDRKGKPVCIGPRCTNVNRLEDDPFRRYPSYRYNRQKPGFRIRRKGA